MRETRFLSERHWDHDGPGRRHHHPDGPGREGPDGEGFRGRRRGRGRAPWGDVRAPVLALLAEEPMHGYQLMQAIADRTGGQWHPSPGAIYPTISQLEDEGLISVTSSAGRKLATLTEAGREHVADTAAPAPAPFSSFAATEGYVDLRGELEQLHGAARQVARTGTPTQ